jgi:hypothetical protein
VPEQNINIHIKLLDEYSANMQKFQSNLQKVAQKGIDLGRTMRQVGREISILGQTMMWTGTAMTAPLILAFKSAEKYSIGVARESERLNAVFIGLRTTIAEGMLPTVKTFTEILGKVYLAFNNVSPATRETIIRFILMNGVILTLGGTLVMIMGKFTRFAGILIDLPSKFTIFATLHPQLLAIALAMGILIGLTQLLGDKNVSFLGKVQLGWDMYSIGCYKAVKALALLGETIQRVLFAGFGANAFKVMANAMQVEINRIEKNMQKVFETGQATGFLGELDDIKKAFADIGAYVKNMPSPNLDALVQKFKDMKLKIETEVKTMADVMNDTMKNVATSMGDSLGNFFGNVLRGQINSAQQMFVNFGNAVLDIIGQVLAKLLISETLGRMFPAFNLLGLKFHQDGIIKAHSGLATDEVPIIAQSGEGIISRRGMASLGRNNFNRLNRGENSGSGGVTINPVLVIKAWDFADIQKHENEIKSMMIKSIQSNSALRTAIKQYC